jgi:ATP-dependent DNA ligase
MMAESISPNENLSKYEGTHIAQRKYDGTRILLIRHNKDVWMMSRSWKNDFSGSYPQIVCEARDLCDDAILDCELTFWQGGECKYIKADALPHTRAEYTPRLMIFDVLFMGGEDMRRKCQTFRSALVEQICNDPSSQRFIRAVESYETDFRTIFDDEISHNGEGIILKDKSATYRHDGVNDNRSKAWLKVKRVETADCVVLGLQTGKGKTASTFGALIVGQIIDKKMKEVARVSGMTDLERSHLLKQISAMPRTYAFISGKTVQCAVIPEMVVEVAFMERTDYGKLRHPRFVCVRTDKSPEGCTHDFSR